MPIDPELKQIGLGLLRDAARVGRKALLTGLDSVLSDVGGTLREGERRVSKARQTVRKTINEHPAQRYTDDEEESDE